MKEVGLSVGAQKTHWTSHPKMIDKSIVCGRTGCAVGRVPGICGGRKCEIRDEFFMAPKKVAPEHCKNHNVAGFSLELERVDDGKDTKRNGS